MSLLTEQQKKALNATIRQVEAQTSAELVTIICQKSDDYQYIPLLWAALSALALPFFVGLLPSGVWLALEAMFEPWQTASVSNGLPYWLLNMQLFMFVMIAALVQIPALKMRLVPKSVRHQRARRHGRELFFIEGLHLTQNRTGILFFVSQAERYVEIMVDEAIQQKIDGVAAEQWQIIVANFVDNIGRGQAYQGYDQAIVACGEVLIEHFPANEHDVNELPDHLIEL